LRRREHFAAAAMAVAAGVFCRQGAVVLSRGRAVYTLRHSTNLPVRGKGGKVWNRRNLVVATRPGEGPFTIRFADLRHRPLPTVVC
jgi:hypothetical protein